MSATNPYTSAVTKLESYKDQIEGKRDSLANLIESLERSIYSSILSANNMQGNYYKKFVEKENDAVDAAKSIRDYVTNTMLNSIDNGLDTLKRRRDSWKPPIIAP